MGRSKRAETKTSKDFLIERCQFKINFKVLLFVLVDSALIMKRVSLHIMSWNVIDDILIKSIFHERGGEFDEGLELLQITHMLRESVNLTHNVLKCRWPTCKGYSRWERGWVWRRSWTPADNACLPTTAHGPTGCLTSPPSCHMPPPPQRPSHTQKDTGTSKTRVLGFHTDWKIQACQITEFYAFTQSKRYRHVR